MKDIPWQRLAESPWFDRLRTQQSRRVLDALYLASLAVLLLATWFVDSYWLLLPLLPLSSLTLLLIHASTRGISGLSPDVLDEHQIAARNAGFNASYMVGVGIAFGGGILVGDLSDWNTAFEASLFIAVFALVTALPTLTLAWTLPGETADE